MHRRFGHRVSGLALAFATAACGGDGGGGTGLFGTWRASSQDAGTEFVFDDNAGNTFDVVVDGGGTVTLAVNANGTFTLTVTVGGFVADQLAGTFVADTSAQTITITETGATTSVLLDYILTGNTLDIATRNFGDVEFDFDGDQVDEPAHLFATFLRR